MYIPPAVIERQMELQPPGPSQSGKRCMNKEVPNTTDLQEEFRQFPYFLNNSSKRRQPVITTRETAGSRYNLR